MGSHSGAAGREIPVTGLNRRQTRLADLGLCRVTLKGFLAVSETSHPGQQARNDTYIGWAESLQILSKNR